MCSEVPSNIPRKGSGVREGSLVRSNLCYLICLRHLIRSRGVTNLIFFSEKTYFPSCVRNMFYSVSPMLVNTSLFTSNSSSSTEIINLVDGTGRVKTSASAYDSYSTDDRKRHLGKLDLNIHFCICK